MSQRRKRDRHHRTAGTAAPASDVRLHVEPLVTVHDVPEPVVVSPTPSGLHVDDVRSIRHDLLKLVIVIVVVVVALVTLIITNQSNGWLNQAAESFYHWLRLG